MPTIQTIIHDLSDITIADRIARKHDQARNRYHLKQNTVTGWNPFHAVVGDYTQQHNSYCMANGATLDYISSAMQGAEIIDREYRRRGLQYNAAVNDGIYGTNGGMKQILDLISEALKADHVRRYMEYVIKTRIQGNSFEAKVEVIKQIFECYGPVLAGTVDLSNPARYANDYRIIIDALVENMRRTSPVFRQL